MDANPERRLIAASFVLSCVLHGAALIGVPGPFHQHAPELPQVLQVELAPQLVAQPQPLEPIKPSESSAPPAPTASTPRQKPTNRPAVERPVQSQPKPVAVESSSVADAAPTTPPAPVASPSSPEESKNPAPPMPPAPPASTTALIPPAVDAGASCLREPQPRYPVAARRNAEEGTVTVRLLVSGDGPPARVELAQSSGSNLLDATALSAVRQWHCVRAKRAGAPYESWASVSITFKFEPQSP